MSKFSRRNTLHPIFAGKPHGSRTDDFPVAGVSPFQSKTFADVEDDLRLKRLLKRAVGVEVAPSELIYSIREMIRR